MELTYMDELILKRFSETGDVDMVASALGLAPSTVYNHFRSIRKKYRTARTIVNKINAYRRNSRVARVIYLEEYWG